MAALEQPKKPAGGAFGRFMAEKRGEFIKQCAGKPISEVSKLGGAEWKKLDDAQKAPYQKQFEEAQKKYNENMAAFLAAGGQKTKGAAGLRAEKRKAKEGKKVEKDPNKPKQPAGGAYGCFLAKNRAAFQKECPGSMTGVAKLAGEKWKALSASEKAPFEKEYTEKVAEYKKAMESYVPPAGAEADADEADTDDEEDEAEEPAAKKAKTTRAVKETKADKKEAVKDAKSPKDAKSGRGRGSGKAKAKDTTPEIELPKGVGDEADAKGYTDVLKRLLDRDDIKAQNVSASKALEVLVSSNGLLHPARRALLGA